LDWLAQRIWLKLCENPKLRLVAKEAAKHGQQVLYIMDPNDTFVPANVKSDDLSRLMDPIHDRILEKLDKGLNIHGKLADDIKAKGRIGTPRRIAESLASSDKMIRRYRTETLPIELMRDGKGSVHWLITPDSVFRSRDIAKGKDRGPGSENSR
jgi:hypothetical protein